MKLSSTVTIALANQKGGCGKTSTAVNLSAGLALAGYRTCLVDLDGQCNSSMTFGIDPEEYRRTKKPTVLDAYLNKRPATQIAIAVTRPMAAGASTPLAPGATVASGEGVSSPDADAPARFDGNLSVLPGHPALAALHQQLEASLRMEALAQQLAPEEEDDHRRDHRERLAKSLDALQGEVDFVVLDTPPELGFLLSTALRAADYFIIPVFPSEYDLNGLQRLIMSAKKIRERSNPKLRLLRVLVGNYDKSTVLDQQIYARLKTKFGELLSKVRIGRGVKMREATSHHLTIFEHAAGSDQAEAFRAFAHEVATTVERALASPPVAVPARASAPRAAANGAGEDEPVSAEVEARDIEAMGEVGNG